MATAEFSKFAGRLSARPFKYDLNQIPYDYTIEVTNRFKRLDLIDRVPEDPWTEVCDVKSSPRKRSARRQNGCLRRS